MWSCPACGRTDFNDIRRITVGEAAAHFVRPWADPERYVQLSDKITSLWGAREARLRTCRDCSLRSADPFVAGDKSFYELAYGRVSYHSYPKWRWEYELTQQVIPDKGTILEIGAGDGAFQSQLIKRGVDPSRLHATEFSPLGRDKLREMGVQVSEVDVRDLGRAEHAIVCAHQVFEHLDRLDEVFHAFDSLTCSTGIVALSVPNGANILQVESKGGLIDMPPNHVSTWTQAAFHALAERYGWEVAQLRLEPTSRARSATALAISRAFQGRISSNSFAARFERQIESPRARYAVMALAAAANWPSSFRRIDRPQGASLWVLLSRSKNLN